MNRPANQPGRAGSIPAARSFLVAPCSVDAARFAVEQWHYSRNLPGWRQQRFGVWETGMFVGAVVFAQGATPFLGSPYGLTNLEVAELIRVALSDRHVTPVTAIVADALALVHRNCPGLRAVISFADTGRGHHGGIYQAGNWIYLGPSHHEWIRVRGDVVHPKTLHTRYGIGGQSIPWLREHVDPDAVRVPMPPKHRYAYPLDRGMRRRLARVALPYPARVDAGSPAV